MTAQHEWSPTEVSRAVDIGPMFHQNLCNGGANGETGPGRAPQHETRWRLADSDQVSHGVLSPQAERPYVEGR